MRLRMGSVCSGMEAATVAMSFLGWKTEFVAEIEPFPCHVLAARHGASRPMFMPDPEKAKDKKERNERASAIRSVANLPETGLIPNFGDLNRVEDWPDAAIDVLIGGTPCQAFSIAGLRKGLDDERGQLTLKYAAAARRYRPRWLVWENVAGVLSDDKGHSFASLLGLLSGNRIEIPPGGWQTAGVVPGLDNAYGLAWRVLDAQFVRIHGLGRAVPQRRRRVFIVGYLGDWRHAAAVLFERESLSGNPPPRRKAGQGFTHDVVSSLVSSGRGVERPGETRGQDPVIAVASTGDISHCLNAGGMGQIDPYGETFISDGVVGGGPENGRISGTVSAKWAKGTGGPAGDETYNLVAQGVSPTLRAGGNQTGGDRPPGTDVDTCETLIPMLEVAHALRADGFDASEDGTGRGTPLIPTCEPLCFDETQITSKDNRCNPQPGDPAHPRRAGARPPTLAFSTKDYGNDVQEDVAPTMRAMGHDGSHANAGGQLGIVSNWRVRRLTPAECLRLQGFPDGYLDITYRGKPAADGPKYKIIGNSKAINCVRWLGTRLEMVQALSDEVAA